MRAPTHHELPPGLHDEASGSSRQPHKPALRSSGEAVRLGAVIPGPLPHRVAAFAIDCAMGCVIAFLYLNFTVFQVVSQLYFGAAEVDEMLDLLGAISRSFWTTLAVFSVITIFYRWSTQSTIGWTLGKKTLGLRAVGLDGGSARPTPSLVREIALAPGLVFALLTIAYILTLLGLPILGSVTVRLGPLYFALPLVLLAIAFWRLDRRGIHDLIGRTQVVRAASSNEALRPSEDPGLISRRIVAFGIDVVFGLVVIFAAGIAWGGVAMISAIALPVLNRTLLPAMFGFTLGKRAMGLQIVRGEGSRAWTIQILVREFVLFVLLYAANLVTILGGWVPATGLVALVLLYIAIHRRDKHSFHDLVAGTCVVRLRKVREVEASPGGVAPQL